VTRASWAAGSIRRTVFDFVLKPARAVGRALNDETLRPLQQTERETLEAVTAIDKATESIEHHVEVIETLANSVGPLTDSVDRLNETLRELVKILEPITAAERGVVRAGEDVGHAQEEIEHASRFFGFRHPKKEDEAKPEPQES
jgi:hypothetical protein